MQPPTLLKRHQIDDQAWNALIDNSAQGVVYAYTWYLDCVSPDWQALVVYSSGSGANKVSANAPVGERSTTSGYLAVMPLPVRSKWGYCVLHQPLFCQYLGFFSQEDLAEGIMGSFLQALSRRYAYISAYDFHPRHTPLLQKLLPSYPEFKWQEKTTHWLDLENHYAEVVGRYKTDRKKNLRKSDKYDWKILKSQDIEPLISLFKENHAREIGNVRESAYVLLRHMARGSLGKQAASIQYASLQGRIHAGIMILQKNGIGIYIFNAADAIGRKGNARTFLLDRYFQQTAGRLRFFDFESPEVASIVAFYESFGAERHAFVSIRKNKLPFPLRQLQEFRKWLSFRHRANT